MREDPWRYQLAIALDRASSIICLFLLRIFFVFGKNFRVLCTQKWSGKFTRYFCFRVNLKRFYFIFHTIYNLKSLWICFDSVNIDFVKGYTFKKMFVKFYHSCAILGFWSVLHVLSGNQIMVACVPAVGSQFF